MIVLALARGVQLSLGCLLAFLCGGQADQSSMQHELDQLKRRVFSVNSPIQAEYIRLDGQPFSYCMDVSGVQSIISSTMEAHDNSNFTLN